MSKIRADSIVDRNDAAAVDLPYGASIPVGQTFSIQGNLNHTGISTVGILTVTGGANISGIVTATTFIGNGAGLVMSTFDLVTDNGGKPATFLDVGGGATTESVYEALTLISKMSRVKGILVNLYGGIVKTTTVAEAFIQAYNNNLIDLPVFARLMGTESDKAKEMLKDTKTKMFDSIEEAINGVVMEANK